MAQDRTNSTDGTDLNGGEEMTIDELARASGMTARNIRAHQSRGLLPAPTVRARTGYYGSEHLARIRLIRDMQAEGFNLKSIERLLEMGARSGSRGALELQRALLEPFGSEEPAVIDEAGIAGIFGDPPDRRLVAKAERIGLLRPIGEGVWEVPSPTLLRAGRDLVANGIPLEHALAVGEAINRHTTAIAKEFVRLFVQDVLEPLRSDGGSDDLAAAGAAVERLRPLASQAVMASFGVVMTEAVERQLRKELR
ncbi:MAG TPA: MerR family transcriptional regulator [Solirubrobacterales bacterium]|nr:MerR family transcriptional regulator [Solirubrobacterales bacterium]